MLYVFCVVNGMMIKFEMEMSLYRIKILKEEIMRKYSVPYANIALLTNSGDHVHDDNLVGKFSATDTNPIFLFSTAMQDTLPSKYFNTNLSKAFVKTIFFKIAFV